MNILIYGLGLFLALSLYGFLLRKYVYPDRKKIIIKKLIYVSPAPTDMNPEPINRELQAIRRGLDLAIKIIEADGTEIRVKELYGRTDEEIDRLVKYE